MTSMENLRKVVEWGIKEGHTVSEIAEGLELDYMTVGTVYMQVLGERRYLPDRLRHMAPKFPLRSPETVREDDRARTDPRYASWLRSTRGARDTRGGKL